AAQKALQSYSSKIARLAAIQATIDRIIADQDIEGIATDATSNHEKLEVWRAHLDKEAVDIQEGKSHLDKLSQTKQDLDKQVNESTKQVDEAKATLNNMKIEESNLKGKTATNER